MKTIEIMLIMLVLGEKHIDLLNNINKWNGRC